MAAYWEQSKDDFRERLPRYPVTVRARPDILERLRVSGRYARVEAEARMEDADGWVNLSLLFEVDWEACEYLLSFGPAVVVLEPPQLRQQIARRAEETVQLYADSD